MLLYRVNAGAQPPDAWVHGERSGGGRIVGEVCHYIDVADCLIDSPARSVYARSLSGSRADTTYYDTVSLTIHYDNGSVATILYLANGNTDFPKEYLEVHRAGASGFLHNYRKLVFKGPRGSDSTRTFSQEKGFVEEAAAFREACRTGRAPMSLDAMIHVTTISMAAMHSLASGETVDLRDPDVGAWTQPVADVAPERPDAPE
jgi:predicted dehydrogenase